MRRRVPARLIVLFVSLFATCPRASESRTSTTVQALETELEVLREKVSALERQNRSILELLASVRSELNTLRGGRPDAAEAARQATTQATAGPARAADPAASVRAEGGGSAVSFYGFVRVDAILDDSRPDSIQTPTFILPEDGARNDADFSLHPRLTRIGMNYRGPVLELLRGARISGKVETDFQNGGRESRAIARYRHAYMQLDWQDSSLLLGQTWDIISPLYPTVNADTMMWNAGNMGDRRMQLRYTYEPDNGLSVRAGLGITGAVDAQDLDGNGVRDGEDAGLPHLQARVGFKSRGGRSDVGVWGHYAREETGVRFGGENAFDSGSIGIDYQFRLHPRLSLKGELWGGSNLSDFRGGIGQSINTASGRGIASRGGWVELGVQASRTYSLAAGYTFDDPRNRDLGPGGRAANRVGYLTHRFQLGAPFVIGADYLYWRTDTLNRGKGTDNRFNVYFLYNF